jgi:hypothetical protein
VTIDGVRTGELIIDHLYTPFGTTSNYNAIANLNNPRITTVPAKYFPFCCVFTRRSPATSSNSGDSLASRCQVLLPQPPLQILSTVNSTIAPYLVSLPCRAQLNWLPQFSSLKPLCTDRIENIFSNNSCCCRGVFTDTLLINGLHNTVVLLLRT